MVLLGLSWLVLTGTCFYALIRFMYEVATLLMSWDISASEERWKLIAICLLYVAVFGVGMYVRRRLLKSLTIKLQSKVAQ